MIVSYHNHTTWSDGTATLRETLEAARLLEIDEIGVSDHWVLHPRGITPRWSMDPEHLGDYCAAVRATSVEGAPPLRLGLEADWFPDNASTLRERLAESDFDYVIGSVHEVRDFRVDSPDAPWGLLDVEDRDEFHRDYWGAVADMARSGIFDIAGHLDLTKKFGHRPSVDMTDEIGEALDAISASDMAVELNTSGWDKPCREAYPSDGILRACRARDIPVLLSADAHRQSDLRRGYERGAGRLRDAGYGEGVRFAGRRRTSVPLPPPSQDDTPRR